MQITVEFSGLARAVTREPVVILELPEGATYHQVAKILSSRYPELIGVIFSADGKELLNANIFSRNGEDIILADQMNNSPQNGDHILLLSVIVGGASN